MNRDELFLGPENVPPLAALSAPYFYFMSNADGEIIYVSESVFQVAGYPPESLIGKRLFDFVDFEHPHNADVKEAHADRFQHTRPKNSVRVARDANGNWRTVEVQSFAESDEAGNIVTNHALVRDITPQSKHEGELYLRLLELEQYGRDLSPREQNVLSLILEGHLNKTIAKKLDVTQRTVENIRSRLMNKFNVNTAAQLASAATELRILRRVTNRLHATHDTAATRRRSAATDSLPTDATNGGKE
ncbi:MAG: PAS domain S-box protein [Planctomycetales bacterium]|nr:PAS domain S-box protein [Planctomycetales bacterium]